MIVKLLFELVLALLNIVFGWVNLPEMPAIVSDSCMMLMYYMRMAMGFVWLIVPKNLVLAVLPIILVLENFDMLYNITMWILRKIPFLGIK